MSFFQIKCIWNALLSPGGSLKKVLHVGCGQATLVNLPKGFQNGEWEEVRLDIAPDVNPDIIGTIQSMPDVPTGSMDAVYSSHNIEHVHFHEVPGVLAEFRRVLSPTGFCVIACPDITTVAAAVIERGLDGILYESPGGPITGNDILYGHSESIEKGAHYMAHKTGFDLPGIGQRLADAGFPGYHGKRIVKNWELRIIAFNERLSEDVRDEHHTRFAMLK